MNYLLFINILPVILLIGFNFQVLYCYIFYLNGWMIWVLQPFQHHRSYWTRLPTKGNEQNGWNMPLNIDLDPQQIWTWNHWFRNPVYLPLAHASSPFYLREDSRSIMSISKFGFNNLHWINQQHYILEIQFGV